jgi:hypothetical protein
MFASSIGLLIVFGPVVLAVIVLLLVGSAVRQSRATSRARAKGLSYDPNRRTHTDDAGHGFIVDARMSRSFVKPRPRDQAGGSESVDAEQDAGGGLPNADLSAEKLE